MGSWFAGKLVHGVLNKKYLKVNFFPLTFTLKRGEGVFSLQIIFIAEGIMSIICAEPLSPK